MAFQGKNGTIKVPLHKENLIELLVILLEFSVFGYIILIRERV